MQKGREWRVHPEDLSPGGHETTPDSELPHAGGRGQARTRDFASGVAHMKLSARLEDWLQLIGAYRSRSGTIRSFRTDSQESASTLKMNEAILDSSCLQRL